MMKNLIVVLSFGLSINYFAGTQNAWAQVAMPDYVPGSSGLAPTCPYGGVTAQSLLEQDEEYSDAKEEKSSAFNRKKEECKADREQNRELEKRKRNLGRVLGSYSSVESFLAAYKDCQAIASDWENGKRKDVEEAAAKANPNDPLSKVKELADKYFIDSLESTFSTTISAENMSPPGNPRYAAACRAALGRKIQDKKQIEPVDMCPMKERGTRTGSETGTWVEMSPDSGKCRAEAEGFQVVMAAANAAKAACERAKRDYADSTKNVSKVRSARLKDLKEEIKERKENGDTDFSDLDAGVRGQCTTGDCYGTGFIRSNPMASAFDKLGPYMLAATGLTAAIDVWGANANSKRWASLGYPTGPNAYINPAMSLSTGLMNYAMLGAAAQANYGYPMAAGNRYGAVNAGQGVGGVGCSQVIGSPIYSNIGQNGMFMGPYAAVPGYAAQQGGFTPMMNGQLGVVPYANGQAYMSPNGLMATCFTAPCNVGGLGNGQLMMGGGNQVGMVPGGYPYGGGGYPYGGAYGNNFGGMNSMIGPGSAFSNLQYSNSLQAQKNGYELLQQGQYVLSTAGAFGGGYSGAGYNTGGYNLATGGIGLNVGLNAGVNFGGGAALPTLGAPGLQVPFGANPYTQTGVMVGH